MTDQPFPDLLVSEARTRHYVAGEMITARRGINWPAGITVTDDPIEEKVDLSGLGSVPAAFNFNNGSIVFSGSDWAISANDTVAARPSDVLLIDFHYNLVTAETDDALMAFQFDVDGTPSASTGFVDGDPNNNLGVPAWLCTGSGNVGGSIVWQVVAEDLFEGTAHVEFLTSTDGADRTADSSSYYVVNLGALA